METGQAFAYHVILHFNHKTLSYENQYAALKYTIYIYKHIYYK